jgi:predicted deacylase
MASIGEALAQPPGHYLAETTITTLALGQPLTYHTHILRGRSPGPTGGPVVGIVSGLHGNEIATAELLLSLLEVVDIDALHGTLLLVPMASALTFDAGTRSTNIDGGDLNRVFPGSPGGTITQMLAHAFCTHFLNACNVLIDTHAEPDAMVIRCSYAFAPADDYGRRSMALARASGSPIIYAMQSLAGSLVDEARKRNIDAVLLETGGPLPGKWGLLAEAQSEILNILRHLQMLPGDVETHTAPAIVEQVTHLRAPVGGLFRPHIGSNGVGQSIAPNLLLGTIVSPFSGELLSELYSPATQSWLMMARCRTTRVHPGDPLYIIGGAPVH